MKEDSPSVFDRRAFSFVFFDFLGQRLFKSSIYILFEIELFRILKIRG